MQRGVRAATYLLLVALIPAVATACNKTGGGGTTPGSTGAGAQTYTGKGHNITDISFSVSGGQVTGLTGHATSVCATGFPLMTVAEPNPIALDGSTFSESVDQDSGRSHLDVSGTLDGNGHATGTLRMTSPGCDTTQLTWSASLPGAAPTTTAPAAACSPQPCGVSSGVTLVVSGTKVLPAGQYVGQYLQGGIEVDATITNSDSASHNLVGSDFKLAAGTEPTVTAGADVVDQQADTAVTCLSGQSLAAGATTGPIAICFPVDSSGQGQNLVMTWRADDSDQTSTIDLGTAQQ